MIDSSSSELSPLILTLALDEQSTAYFNQLRATHFPPAINFLQAHLTLFHKLPADQPTAMAESIALINSVSSFSIQITQLMNLGRGVAFRVSSLPLEELRAGLKNIWRPWITAQDNHGFRPHITIQNKVSPEAARELLANLSANFSPFKSTASGITCYKYLDGPWEFQTHISFRHV